MLLNNFRKTSTMWTNLGNGQNEMVKKKKKKFEKVDHF